MIRQVIAISCLLVNIFLYAHDFEAINEDGMPIYYNITSDSEVAVTFRGESYYSYNNEYSGELNIPSSVTYSGTTYSVTSIGSQAFCWCQGLSSITIPSTVTSVEGYAFYCCTGLISITIPHSVSFIRARAFESCKNLSSINLPNSITEIAAHTFRNCSNLKDVHIPSSVTSIGDGAFFGCSSLESINIPKFVTSVGSSAFLDCTNLTAIYAEPLTPPACGYKALTEISKENCTLYVKAEAKTDYAHANQWKDFIYIESYEFIYEGVEGDTNGDGIIDASDIAYMVEFLLGSKHAGFDEMVADLNYDGVIDAADIAMLISLMLE